MNRRWLALIALLACLSALWLFRPDTGPTPARQVSVQPRPSPSPAPPQAAPLDEPPPPAAPEPLTPTTASSFLHEDGAALALLTGHVVDETGQPARGAIVVATGETGALTAAKVGPDGSFRFSLPPGRVLVHASRADGLIDVRSEEELVTLTEGQRAYVPLSLTAAEGGDVGVVAVEHPEGFRITWVVPHTDAEAAGLSAGDVVTAIDGVAATELTSEGFERAIIGEPGTEVVLTVRLPNGTLSEVPLERWTLHVEDVAEE